MDKIIDRIEESNYDIRDNSLIDIAHYIINDKIVSLDELERVKALIDSSIKVVNKEIDIFKKL